MLMSNWRSSTSRRASLVEADGLAVGRLLAREGEEIHHQLGGAVAFVRGLFQVGAGARAEIVVRQHQFQVALDDGERVVEFVRDAGNHLPDGGKLFRLAQLLFQLRALGQFDEEKLVGGAAVEINQRAVDLHRRERAVFADQIERALAAEGQKPFLAGLRRRVGLAFDLAKRAQAVAAGFRAGMPSSRSAAWFNSRMRRSSASVMRMASLAWSNSFW